jgi:hypothetical protein
MTTVSWFKSSRCADRNCVEVAALGGLVAMRDSANADQPYLTFTRGGWASFLAGVSAGEFDRP